MKNVDDTSYQRTDGPLLVFEKCKNDGLKNTIWFADKVDIIPSSVRPSDLNL